MPHLDKTDLKSLPCSYQLYQDLFQQDFGWHRKLMWPTRISAAPGLIKHYVSGAAPVSSLTCGWVSLPREHRMPRGDACKCRSTACRMHGAICYYYFPHSRCLHPGQITQCWQHSLHIIDLKSVTEDGEEKFHRKCNASLRSKMGFYSWNTLSPKDGAEGTVPLSL